MISEQIKKGIGFGLTSGTVTTLGLIIGLYTSTQSKLAVISGIATIAVVDSFSDALGIHISEESENKHTSKDVWLAILSTLFFKAVFALTFVIPFLMFPIGMAAIIALIYGTILLILFSINLARTENKPVWPTITEHLFVFFSGFGYNIFFKQPYKK